MSHPSRLNLAKDIILKAGQMASESFKQQGASFTTKGPQDYLTETDEKVERFIIQQIQTHFPEDAILGEETGATQIDKEFTWVIDPIDGTANFARRIPHYAVCIALVNKQAVEWGLIYQPETQELFMAQTGQGAFCNKRRMQVASAKPAAACTIEFGWSNKTRNADYIQALDNLLEAGFNVRRGASGALALAWVADGRTDGYGELWMQPWDCLAGLLMIREAGGEINLSLQQQQLFALNPVLASIPSIADALSTLTGIRMNETTEQHEA